MSTITKISSKQFLMLGQDPPGIRLELAHGEIVVSPSPSPDHSEIILNLGSILRAHIRQHKLGRIFCDTDTVFDHENTRRPDLLFFATNRLHLVGKKTLNGPPDLCVEVLSPSSIHMDRDDKFKLFEQNGVPHYWILDPDARTLEAFRLVNGRFTRECLAAGADTVHLSPFESLAIPLSEVWPER